jgi:hypothetical protein
VTQLEFFFLGCWAKFELLNFAGGFGSYLLGMNGKSYARLGPDYPGNRAEDVKDPSMGWMTAYLFTVSFLGIFSLVPLRQVSSFSLS